MATDPSGISLGNVLVVGGSGFLGSHCIEDVLRAGASEVHTLNSHTPPADKQIPGVTYHAADLGDAPSVTRILSLTRPLVVIHVASPRPFIEFPSVYERVNIQGTRNLLSASAAAGSVRAFVYCSSGSVVHDGHVSLRYIDESAPVLFAPTQREPYWHSKAMAEKAVLEANSRAGPSGPLLTTALRVTSIFGERDAQITGGIVERAKQGQLKTQIGPGTNRNDWTYVGNIAAAHTHAARRLLRAAALPGPEPADIRVEGEAFFVTNDDPRSFWGFAEQMAAEAGYPVDPKEITHLPTFMAFVIGYVAEWAVYISSLGQKKSAICRRSMRVSVIDQIFCMDKAKRQLGFTPQVGIDEAIKRSVASIRKEAKGTSD